MAELGGTATYEQVKPLFEAMGFARVKADLQSGEFAAAWRRSIAQKWINNVEAERLAEQRYEETERAERAVQAAQESARASGDAARWAMWAAFIALATTVAAVFKDLFLWMATK